MSWQVACTEMGEQKGKKLKKALKGFLPTADRMTHLVTGSRMAGNKHSVLAPGKDNLVQMQRRNCRIDEGTNELILRNQDQMDLWKITTRH